MSHDLREGPNDTSLLRPAKGQLATLCSDVPILIIAIDTEAEFDWNGPFLRSHTSVHNIRNQLLAQAIFDRIGVRPVYLVDYAVATQSVAYNVLRQVAETGRCEIGAHLHPWITPPFTEQLTDRTSFSHNLPGWLQREKLKRLTDAIVGTFGIQPVSYRAGRYGVGEEAADILRDLGYRIDMSVQPGTDMRRIHGPDFRHGLDQPYWFGKHSVMLEIPANNGFTGLMAHRAWPKHVSIELYKQISKPSLNRFGSLGVFARLRLLERIPLSPEGTTLPELQRVTYSRFAEGRRVFVLSYHSSSLLPGCTEYVRSESDLARFLETIEGFIEFFVGQMGGISMTPTELRAALLKDLPNDDHRRVPN